MALDLGDLNIEDFEISEPAREKGDRIFSAVTKGIDEYKRSEFWVFLQLPAIGQFPATDKEREYLNKVARVYNAVLNETSIWFNKTDSKEVLVAHGTQSVLSLSQILLDGKFRHLKDRSNFAALCSYSDNMNESEFHDNGWGVFVARAETAESAEAEGEYKSIPLGDLEAVLLPTPIVNIVRNEFPEHAQLLKGYSQYADELKQRLRYRLSLGRGLNEYREQVLIDVSLHAGEEIKRNEMFDHRYLPFKTESQEEIAQFIREKLIPYIKRKFGEKNSSGEKIYCISYGHTLPADFKARLGKIVAEE